MRLILFYFIIHSFCLVGCKEANNLEVIDNENLVNEKATLGESEIIKDDFENGIAEFWEFEIHDSTRVNAVEDPADAKNKALKVDLKLDDYNSGGRRSEIRLMGMEPLNYLTKYSFDFYLPESFFDKNDPKGIIFLHQWHDQADPGFNWSTQNKTTHPPIRLFVDINESGEYKLVFGAGLETGHMNEVIYTSWKENLEPNRWYSFSCEIFWHIYTDVAYAMPMLDGEYLYHNKDAQEGNEHKIFRRNMYNGIGNYFKLGLYMFGKQHAERYALFDNVYIETIEHKCF